ncbi:hypothetical protein Pd630_LPD06271 [Rhodococcus opacus PD630]|nr:hypothetical protein Pd630_LPD06271 [Rhodococcus opacus PD630]
MARITISADLGDPPRAHSQKLFRVVGKNPCNGSPNELRTPK